MNNDKNLKRKIGQLFMVGIPGTKLDDKTLNRIQNLHIGSFILFRKNTPDPKTTAILCNDLQNEAQRNNHDLELLLAIDQEHGRVIRINNGLTIFPCQQDIGKIGDESISRKTAEIIGKELRLMGLNINFSPVADVNSNPKNPVIGDRSFGDNAQLAAQMTAQYIKGYQDAEIISCAKHFPGHGDVTIDSHLDLPVVEKTIDELFKTELVPFQKAIDQKVPTIMTAHILYKKIDPKYPATASYEILENLLRKKLGFKGVIISDDLQMKALTRHYDLPELTIKIINAGCDLLIFSENLDCDYGFEEIYDCVYKSVKSNKISMERIDEAVNRIIQLKRSISKKEIDISKLMQDDDVKFAQSISNY